MKRMIIRIALVFALSIAVVEPIAMTQTTEVAVAKKKLYNRIKLNKMYSKLRIDQTTKKVKKIFGIKSLGKKTVIPTKRKKPIISYTIRFYLEKGVAKVGTVLAPKMGYSDITVKFYNGKLEDWGKKSEEWIVDENGNKVDNPYEYYNPTN